MKDATLELLERGDDLLGAIGSMWTQIYRDREFLNALFRGYGFLSRQTVEDYRHAADCLNRNTIPVTRSKLVRQVTLTVSEANRGRRVHKPRYGEDGLIFASDSLVYGDVVESGFYEFETELNVTSIALLSDSLINPENVFTQFAEFDIVQVPGEASVIRFTTDPFNGQFPGVQTVQEAGLVSYTLNLWATDVRYSDTTVADFFGTPLDVHDVTEIGNDYKAFVNACWNAVQLGPSVGRIRSLLAAICGVPIVLSDNETVVSVTPVTDATWVVTSANAYRLGPNATGMPAVGTILDAGDFLSTDVQMFDLAELRDKTSNEIADLIPALGLSTATIVPAVGEPLAISAGLHPVTSTLVNGHPAARVPAALLGRAEDMELFWDYADSQFPGFHQMLTGSGTKPLPATFDLLKYVLTELLGPDGTLCTLNINNLDRFDYARLGWLRRLYPPGRTLIVSLITVAQEEIYVGVDDEDVPPAEYIQADTPSDTLDDVPAEPGIEPGSYEQ